MHHQWPTLVLDRICCHVLGAQSSDTYLAPWHALLMAMPPAAVPRYVRTLLRQCADLSIINCNKPPALGLIQAWLTSFTLAELDFGIADVIMAASPLVAAELVDWLCDPTGLLKDLTADIVDAVSAAGGAPALDWLWKWRTKSLKKEFPYSIKAVDSARDAATLQWWWQWHRDHQLPFKYNAAVLAAFVGRELLDLDLSDPAAARLEGAGTQLEKARWWRDRAVADGLALAVQFNNGDDDSDDADTFTLTDLVGLAVANRLSLIEVWASLVDSNLLPPVQLPRPATDDDYGGDENSLESCRMFDAPVLDWWLARHRSHGLPMPDTNQLQHMACADARTDTLDWLWRTSRLDPGAVGFFFPEHLYVSRKTLATAPAWWWATVCSGQHERPMPTLCWMPDEGDTLADLQTFWDLQHHPNPVECVHGGHRALIEFPACIHGPDADVLRWAVRRATPGPGSQSPHVPYEPTQSFEEAWRSRRFATLDELVNRNLVPPEFADGSSESGDYDPFQSALQYCLEVAAKEGSTELLQWWWRHHEALAIRTQNGDMPEHVHVRVLWSALGASQFEFAEQWRSIARQAGITESVPAVYARVCAMIGDQEEPGRIGEILRWVVANISGDGVEVDIADLVKDADMVGNRTVLEWLASEGMQITVADLEDEELQLRWEGIRRAARLSMLPTHS
ncbi:hypothetical protein BC828DRAFT_390940 [Blastocladiella britannica]|nr:hypothetical protein BC828DRAFT_390940 [Blastocladiella britannica]